MKITATSTNRNLISTTISIISTIHRSTTIIISTRSSNNKRGFRASAFRTGFARYARLRFARVPRVLFCSGSTRGVAFKFL